MSRSMTTQTPSPCGLSTRIPTWRSSSRGSSSRSGPRPGATRELAAHEGAAIVWTRAHTVETDGTLRVLSAFRPRGGTFGSLETLSDRDLFGFEPQVAVDERDNALAVWTQADEVEPNTPSLSLIQFAFRARK
jgi:hypothetical protein